MRLFRQNTGRTSAWHSKALRRPASRLRHCTTTASIAGHVLLCCWESHPLFQRPAATLGVRLRPPCSPRRDPATLPPSRPPAALIVLQGICASRQLEWVELCSAGPFKHGEGSFEEGDREQREDSTGWEEAVRTQEEAGGYNRGPSSVAQRPPCAAHQRRGNIWYAWETRAEKSS